MNYVVGAATVAAVTGAQVRWRPCAMAHTRTYLPANKCISETACEILCVRVSTSILCLGTVPQLKRAQIQYATLIIHRAIMMSNDSASETVRSFQNTDIITLTLDSVNVTLDC